MSNPIKKISAKKFLSICVHRFTIEYLRDHYQENAVSLRRLFETDDFYSSVSQLAAECGRTINDHFRASLIRRLLALAVEMQEADVAAEVDDEAEGQRIADQERQEEYEDFMQECFDELSSSFVNDHHDKDDETLRDLIRTVMADNLLRLAHEHAFDVERITDEFQYELGEMLLREAWDIDRQALEQIARTDGDSEDEEDEDE